jgi:hypothetical protein
MSVIVCNICKTLSGHAVVTEDGLSCAWCELDSVVPMMEGVPLTVYKTNWPKEEPAVI